MHKLHPVLTMFLMQVLWVQALRVQGLRAKQQTLYPTLCQTLCQTLYLKKKKTPHGETPYLDQTWL